VADPQGSANVDQRNFGDLFVQASGERHEEYAQQSRREAPPEHWQSGR
jgi:hypothetical protein